MKILWVCNIVLPEVAERFNTNKTSFGGWILGLKKNILKNNSIDLHIVFPADKISEMKSVEENNVKYWGIPRLSTNPTKYDKNFENDAKKVLEIVKPDIVHIWGTEFPHSLAIVKAIGNSTKSLVSIQGLCYIYEKHYFANLGYNVVKKNTLRDFLKMDNIMNQRQKFSKRGSFEIKTLQSVENVIGRTTWDYACSLQINPKLNYYFCNEILREEFYKHQWKYEKCEKYSIFLSQGQYPIKGLHYMIEALPIILTKYPQCKVYVGGLNILNSDTLKEKLLISSYGLFLRKKIITNNLENNVFFTEPLSEKEMCQQFLKSHVFVSPSTIENESNSVSEAKILGVPVVASYVGGVIDRIEHGQDGFLYQHDAPYMLAHYVCEIFKNDELALKFSKNGREKALKTHDPKINMERQLEIYDAILRNNK